MRNIIPVFVLYSNPSNVLNL